MKICKNCGVEIPENKTYCSLTCRNIYVNKNLRDYSKVKKTFANKKALKEKEYFKNPTICLECGNILPYDKRNAKFCDHSCSASYTNKKRGAMSEDTKKKISNALSIELNRFCKFCGKEFITHKSRQQYCSVSCGQKSRRNNRDLKKLYSSLANFKFNLNNFPDEFNFDLIREHGWYQAKNHGDNLDGVSRDHMISKDYGFKNKINPLIIAHPANCELIRQKKNSSKYINNSIDLDELLNKIEKWDKKYGSFYKDKVEVYIEYSDLKEINKII